MVLPLWVLLTGVVAVPVRRVVPLLTGVVAVAVRGVRRVVPLLLR